MIDPVNILVSALKRVDNAVFSFVQSIVDETYVSGITNVGMAEGFAGLSWMWAFARVRLTRRLLISSTIARRAHGD